MGFSRTADFLEESREEEMHLILKGFERRGAGETEALGEGEKGRRNDDAVAMEEEMEN